MVKEQKKVISFSEMTTEQQELFFEEKRKEINEKYKVLTDGLSGTVTHTLILESGLGCILRKPTAGEMRLVMKKIISMSGDSDLIGAGEIILDSCWIAGDKLIKEDPDLRFSASMQASGLISVMQGALKKN